MLIMIPVYEHGQSRRMPAAFLLPSDAAQELVDTAVADWEPRKQKCIILRQSRPELRLRGLSCRMPAWLMDPVAAGESWALAIAEAWNTTRCYEPS
jgi:hypothetical protein